MEAAEPSADVDTQPTSTPIPGEDVSNLLDATPVTEEHTSKVICDSGDHRQLELRGPAAVRVPGCNPDLAAELVYVPAILARSSA